MTEFHLASGTVTIVAGKREKMVATGLTDSSFEPVMSTTPYGENANVNAFLKTSVRYVSGQWQLIVSRSIMGNSSEPAPEQTFFWKVIAMKTVPEIGPTVTPVSS